MSLLYRHMLGEIVWSVSTCFGEQLVPCHYQRQVSTSLKFQLYRFRGHFIQQLSLVMEFRISKAEHQVGLIVKSDEPKVICIWCRVEFLNQVNQELHDYFQVGNLNAL